MLTASSDRRFGTSRLRSTIVLERTFRLHVIRRDRLVFDTRYHPSTRPAAGVTLYVVLHGQLQFAGVTTTGPRAYVLAAGEFERVDPGSTTLRVWGAPSVTIEIRLAERELRVPIGLAAGPLVLSDAVWERCRALVDACANGESVGRHVRELIGTLGDDGVIDAAVATSIRDAEPAAFVRLWGSVLRPLYTNHATSTSVSELEHTTGLSLRQLGRDLVAFTRQLGLGDGFREASRVLRLRAAIALMSAPGATATEVAKQVGYRSLDAMGRAFRDAQLPPPSEVLAAVRYCD